MKDLGLDFGLLIAYLVPGVIVAAALQPLAPDLFAVFRSTPAESAVLSIALALVAGMVVSLLRGSTIDPSFSIDLHQLGLLPSKPQYGPCKRVEVEYRALIGEGVLAAFKEAVLQEKRPYQFYGNTLIATAIWTVSRPSLPWTTWSLAMAVWALLYIGARRSHFVFMTTVRSLNAENPRAHSPERGG